VSVNGLADPVAQGFVASLARPGGNLTGVVSVGGTYAKSAELLAEAVPTGRRLAYLGNVSTSSSPHGEVTEAAAGRGLDVLVVDVPTHDRLEPAFEQAVAWGADLLTAQSVIPLNVNANQLPSLALRAQLPAASSASGRPWVEGGFLLHYGGDNTASPHRAAWYVARILAGADPGDLPFERIGTARLTVNRATLTYLGLTLPEHVAVQVTDWVG
jgi:putative ABC transport system substrate-binding protein